MENPTPEVRADINQAAFLREGIRQAFGWSRPPVDDLELFNQIRCMAESEEEGEEIVNSWQKFYMRALNLLAETAEESAHQKGESLCDHILRLIVAKTTNRTLGRPVTPRKAAKMLKVLSNGMKAIDAKPA